MSDMNAPICKQASRLFISLDTFWAMKAGNQHSAVGGEVAERCKEILMMTNVEA